jgi:hypothetical protein
MDYDENPDGSIVIERMDPIQMLWDADATKKNISDARRVFRVKDLPSRDALDLLPEGMDEEDLHAGWAEDWSAEAHDPHNAQLAPFYRIDQSGKVDKQRSRVRLVEVQWWEYEDVVRLIDPFTGQDITMEPDEYEVLVKRLSMLGKGEPLAVKQKRRKYWRALLGAKLLKKWQGPDKGGFTWKCITGDRNRNKGTFYGIVKAMMDPQRWANKWLAQTLHIINTGAKGGIIAELDAFDDPDEAEENWADPTSIIWAAPGAVRDERIMPRPQNQLPAGLSDLLQLALSSIRDTTGVNLETLGMVEQDQPGVLEQMRKKAGMTVLAGIFNNLRRYRKQQGRLLLWYITEFMSDNRLIRIVGQDKAQYVPLVRQPDTVEYDIIVDDTPTSPDQKEQIWGTLVSLMPFLQRMPVPAPIYMELLKYSPLPATVVAKIASIMQSTPQQPSPEMIVAQATAKNMEAKGLLLTAQAQAEGQKAPLEAARLKSETQRSATQAAIALKEQEGAAAKVELDRSTAILNLAKAGATHLDASTQALLTMLQSLDVINGGGQETAQ